MMTFGLPVLVLGGGGYRINNVARCWAYETGRILGEAFTTPHRLCVCGRTLALKLTLLGSKLAADVKVCAER